MLLIDLDDTIFQTSSINPQFVEPAVSVVKQYYEKEPGGVNMEEMISALWTKPIDTVFSTYMTPKAIIDEFYGQIARVDFSELAIHPFDDYKFIQALSIDKILVTTGLRELQLGKIKALGIGSDFDSIRIDDPRENPRQYKIDIFSQILVETKMAPEEIWVIGDNPESEIKAGKALGMKTIQRRSKSKESSPYADYEIDSFEELPEILEG